MLVAPFILQGAISDGARYHSIPESPCLDKSGLLAAKTRLLKTRRMVIMLCLIVYLCTEEPKTLHAPAE